MRRAIKEDVTIQMRYGSGGPWANVGVITSNNYGIIQATLTLHPKITYWLRGVAPGSGASLPFALRVPYNENLHVDPFPLS